VLLSRPMLLAGTAMVAWLMVVLVGGQALLSLTGHSWSPGVFGFLLGAAVACVPWTVWMVATEVDGSWSWRIGAMAERHTSEALARLGKGWRFQYNMVFYGGTIEQKTWISDIDCVATGPAGILAVSTKWTSDRWDLADPSDEWLLAAARVAARNAARLAGPVRQVLPVPPITPVVVCWGPQLEPIPAAASHLRLPGQDFGDILIVNGDQAGEWLPLLTEERLDPDTISRVDEVVARWISDYEDRHRRTQEARDHAARFQRWSNRLAGLTAAVAVAVSASWVAAVFSRSALRFLDHLVRLGGGLGAVLYMVVPFLLPLASAVVARRTSGRAVAARLKTSQTGFAVSIGSWIMWATTITAVFVFA
jgi:hypothetical protein